jgi:hypothetical protein
VIPVLLTVTVIPVIPALPTIVESYHLTFAVYKN